MLRWVHVIYYDQRANMNSKQGRALTHAQIMLLQRVNIGKQKQFSPAYGRGLAKPNGETVGKEMDKMILLLYIFCKNKK